MKKYARYSTLAILSLTFLFGCGAAPTQSEGISGEDSKNDIVSLKIWGSEDDQNLLTEIATKFQAKYPDTTFEFTIEAQGESDCKTRVLNDVANAADVFTFADDQFAAFTASGVIKPIPDSDAIRSRNLSAAVNAAMMHDQLYAYPLTADNGYFLFYNKKYLSDSDVLSMDALLSKAESLDKKITFDVSSGWYAYSFFGNTGLEMGLNDDGMTNYCNWNETTTPIKGVDIAKAIFDIFNQPAILCEGDGGLVDGAKNDTVIAGVSGVWLASSLQNVWGNDLCAAKLPTYTCNGSQVQLASYAGYKLVGVNSYSPYVEWAYKFADFMSSEECQKLRFEMRMQGPSNINASKDPSVAASVSIQALLAQSEFASLQRVGNAYWDPMNKFGSLLAQHNPDNIDFQELVDTLVDGITKKN